MSTPTKAELVSQLASALAIIEAHESQPEQACDTNWNETAQLGKRLATAAQGPIHERLSSLSASTVRLWSVHEQLSTVIDRVRGPAPSQASPDTSPPCRGIIESLDSLSTDLRELASRLEENAADLLSLTE